ncbi:MAG: flagellar biosynthetic protein FliO [Desulfococcaceae bacterium]
MTGDPDLAFAALRMLGALASLSILLVGALYLARKYGVGARGGGDPIRVLATRPLGARERIALIQIPGAVLVLGVTRERIELLDRIADPEQMRQLESRPETRDFKELLGKALGRKSGAGRTSGTAPEDRTK